MGQIEFASNFSRLRDLFESWLEAERSKLSFASPLQEAVRSALGGGGKRVRPVLCLAAAEAFGVAPERLRPFTLAVEYLHTSSLIHDDLPALDNDDLRRGEPSTHKRYGEATAILAGDLLMILSFRALTSAADISPAVRMEWLELLARAGCDLCDGQMLDLRAAGKAEALTAAPTLGVEELCRKKTGALFEALVCAPALLAPDKGDALATMREYGAQLGLLFQITDDLLDDSEDEVSYVREFGHAGAEGKANEAESKALSALPPGDQFEVLRQFVREVRARKS